MSLLSYIIYGLIVVIICVLGVLLYRHFRSNSIHYLARNALFASDQDAIFLADSQCYFKSANSLAIQLYPALRQLKSKDQKLDEIIPALIGLFTGGECLPIEKKGIVYQPTALTLIGHTGPAGFLVRLLDITSSVERDAWIRRDEAKRKLICEMVPVVVFEWDMTKNIIHYSLKFEELFGYVVNEAKPLAVSSGEIIHPDDYHISQRIQNEMRKGQEQAEVEYRIKRIAGEGREEYIWCRVHTRVIRNMPGGPWAIGTITDIDQEKKRRDTLLDAKSGQ